MGLLEVSDDKARVLLLAIQSLEGALTALKHPLPAILGELRNELTAVNSLPAADTSEGLLTGGEAAKLLRCSPRYVRLLGDRGSITLVHAGGRGRGNVSYYDAESVQRWARHRRQAQSVGDDSGELPANTGGDP